MIAGDSEGFAVFLDQATNNVVRLKTGQDHQGWMLRSVKGREATLEKNKRTTTLALPAPNADIAAAAPATAVHAPAPAGAGRFQGCRCRRCATSARSRRCDASAGGRRCAAARQPPFNRSATRAIPGDPRPLEDQL